jgi:tRNA(adenine34) deaminase
MAEGLLRGMAGDRFEVFSAGTEATSVKPEAISVMAEIGVDISTQESETLDRYLGESLDLVITVCADANEACPVFPGARERLRAFRNVRDEIRARIEGELWRNQGCESDISEGQTAIIGFVTAPLIQDPSETDIAMMRRALLAAEEAAEKGEVPVGAVVARGEEILAVAANEREATGDPTAHAELLAIRRASAATGGWRLTGFTLYATLEPCPMCAGAAHASRLSRLVYAAPDPKAGYAGTLHNIPADSRLNHTLTVESGLLEERAAALLRDFFQYRRRRPGKTPGSPLLQD